MSQHINPAPKQTDVDSVNSKIGNVGSTDLQAQITSLNSNITSMVKILHSVWGYKLDIPFTTNNSGFHALVMINHTDMYVLWNNASAINYTKIFGTANITVERNGTTVTVTTPGASSITAFYMN